MQSITIGSTKIHDIADASLRYNVYIPIKGINEVPQRVFEFNRAGEDGSYIANIFQGQRIITITGRIIAQNADDYQALRKTLSALKIVSRDANGILQDKVCTFVTDDSVSYVIGGQVVNMLLPDQYLKMAPFSFDIKCSDWFFQSSTTKSLDLMVDSGGGFILPVILPAVFAAGVGNTGVAANNGDVPTFPTIVIQGPVTNPRVFNVTTGKYISLAVTLSSTDTLTINMRNKTATINTGSGMQYILSGSSWWNLAVGDNSIFFSSSNPVDTGTMTMTFSDSFSGL